MSASEPDTRASFAQAVDAVTHTSSDAPEGFVEGCERHDAAECLVLYGWVSRRDTAHGECAVTAEFQRGTVSASAQIAFHDRPDLGGRGVGFVALVPAGQGRFGQLLRFKFGEHQIALMSSAAENEGSERSVVAHAAALLSSCFPQPNIARMRTLLTRRFVGEGYIDAYGYHFASAGWFIAGWVSNDWICNLDDAVEVVAHFDTGCRTGAAVFNFLDRPDLAGTGMGIILHLSSQEDTPGQLQKLVLATGESAVSLRPAETIKRIPNETLSGCFATPINDSELTPSREKLRHLLSHAAFDGRDTLADLPDQVLMGVDETIRCGQDSVILIGWLLARHGTIAAMRLRSGSWVFDIDLNTATLWSERPDVADTVGRDQGFEDRNCGFIMRVPTVRPVGSELYLEIETRAGDIGFKPLPRPRLDGIGGIKRILATIETQYNDVDSIYDHVLGPAIMALNAQRLAMPLRVQPQQFGPPIPSPRHSVIVPLYRRIDFMEIQLALFATQKIGGDVEIIYVLDDPPRMREAQLLAASLYERFRVPFKLVCLSHNVGFAPANNVGVRASSGDMICFVNSDVFPITEDWLDRLAAHLEADPTLGVVGPVLLFEDGSVQHQGIAFRTLPQFGNWAFPMHKRKGFRLPPEGGLVREDAITGACMMMRREDVMAYGAFDEAFIIGDFEDTDLCFRLRKHGLGAAVDLDVRMHHLERKSQAGSAALWRGNLTLYNAWVHQRRWAGTIRQRETAP
jgi:GT2 family glycosyltransferase